MTSTPVSRCNSKQTQQFTACSGSFLERCAPTAHLFTLKNPTEATTGGDGNEEEDDFHTDDGEDMEVDTPALQKRKKVRVRLINVHFDGGGGGGGFAGTP